MSNNLSKSGIGIDRRYHKRRTTHIRVEITHPSFGTIMGTTQDISDGGASVKIESQAIPPVGTEVNVRFIKVAGTVNEEPVKMKIMHHHQRNIIGLAFVS